MNRRNICQIDKNRIDRLPSYVIHVRLRDRVNKFRLIPTVVRLDSLADVNWISSKYFKELNSRFKLDIESCNVAC